MLDAKELREIADTFKAQKITAFGDHYSFVVPGCCHVWSTDEKEQTGYQGCPQCDLVVDDLERGEG